MANALTNQHAMDEFVRVCRVSDVPDPGKQVFEVEGEFVVVFHVGGQFFALSDMCTHDGGPLGEGRLLDHRIICPRHGAQFDIRTGAALTMPATSPTPRYEIKVDADEVFVRIRPG